MTAYHTVYLLLFLLPVVAYVAWRGRRHAADAVTLKETVEAGLDEPPSLHPVIDPSRCIGSSSCVRACPEGALGIVGGKAVLVNASACIGHGACQAACAFDAIGLVFGTDRRGIDIPDLSPRFETSVPGIYIAGELGGMGLIRKAAEQGRQAMDAIHAHAKAQPRRGDDMPLDVVIVGCGPAGISAGLAAKAHGLSYRLIEQEDALGGTVYHYPRNKIAMTAPVQLAIVGTMRFGEVRKERLIEFWEGVVRKTGLDISFSERMDGIDPLPGGGFVVRTSRGEHRARHVLLAIGRRGTPRKLGVAGEESAKVVYRLVDADQYRGQRVLVVGGGDSALEAAITLAQAEGTTVTLSYRSAAFARVKAKNRAGLQALADAGRVTVLLNSNVQRIDADAVTIDQGGQTNRVRNDAVIVCAGGLLPTDMLRKTGITFETKRGTA